MKLPLYITAEKDSNRALALLDRGLIDWTKQSDLELIECQHCWLSAKVVEEGLIDYLLFKPIDNSKPLYRMIVSFPESISIIEAYEYLKF